MEQGAKMDKAKAKRIAAALMWLPIDAESDDGLEDILDEEQGAVIRERIVAALLDADAYDMPISRTYPPSKDGSSP